MRRLGTYLYYRVGVGFDGLGSRLSSCISAYRNSRRRNRRHPRLGMVWVACYAAGIGAAESFHVKLETAFCALTAVLVPSCICLHQSAYRRVRWQWPLLFCLGMVICSLQTPPEPLDAWLEPAAVTGVITKIQRIENTRMQAVVRLEEIRVDAPQQVICYRIPKRRLLKRPWLTLLTIYLPPDIGSYSGGQGSSERDAWDLLVPGRTLRFESTLRLPQDSGNPGLFDYRAYLRRQGILLTASVGWEKLEIGPMAGYRINRSIDRISRYLKNQMRLLLPERYGVIAGLVLGDTVDIVPQDKEAFRKAGVSHILSVSGLHVGFIYLLVAWAVKRLHLNKLCEIGLTVFGLGGFVLLAGAKAPAVRAGLGILGGLLLQGGNQKPDSLSMIIASSLVILTLAPLSLFDVGFQLSYAAVLGIIILMPRLQRILPDNTVGRGIATSLAASLATMPLCAYYFFTVSMLGPLANLIVVPLVSAVMPLAIAGLLGQAVVPNCTALIAYPLDYLVQALIGIARVFAWLPGAEVVVGQPRPVWLVLYYLGLFWAFRKLDLLTYLSAKLKVRIWLQLALMVLAWWLWTPVLSARIPEFCLTAVDVGQGDCFVVRDTQGLEMIIDGGGVESKYASFDVGERITLPFLQRMGLARVDVVVNTHPHIDHLSGLIPVANKLDPQVAIDNGRVYLNSAYDQWRVLVADESVRHLSFQRVRKVMAANQKTRVQIIQPMDSGAASLNDSCLVTKVAWGPWSILLTGDLEADGIRALLLSGYDLSADVLQIPHHGAANRYLASLIDAVNPKLAFISVGYSHFGHPASSTLRTLEQKGVPVLRTDLDGAISFAVTAKPRWSRAKERNQVLPLTVFCGRGKTILLEK